MKLQTSTYLHETIFGMADIVTWRDTKENISGIDIYLNTKFVGSIKPLNIATGTEVLEKLVEDFLSEKFKSHN